MSTRRMNIKLVYKLFISTRLSIVAAPGDDVGLPRVVLDAHEEAGGDQAEVGLGGVL